MKAAVSLHVVFKSLLSVFLIAITSTGFSVEQDTTNKSAEGLANEQNFDLSYVTNDLFTYMRSGPGNQYRLLGSVNAGVPIQVLQTDTQNGYTQIIDDRQRTGWIESRFVSKEPSYKIQFEQISKELAQNQTLIEGMRLDTSAAKDRAKKAVEQANQLNRSVTEYLEEIARLNETIDKRERENNMQWFTRGSIVAIIAIIIGYIMGLTGRRNRSRNRMM